MKIDTESEAYCVCDDVLPSKARAAVLDYARAVPLTMPHAEQYQRVFAFDDGTPWFGPAVVAYFDPARRRRERATHGSASHFPTNTPIDFVLQRLLRAARRLRPWVGTAGKDWTAITARLAVYPSQTGLSWHDDANDYSGAFSCFVHPSWEFDWGGELMLLDGPSSKAFKGRIPAPNRPADPLRGRCLEPDDYTKTLGSFVIPVPNRMVVLRGGVTHAINPVRVAAGRVPRMAISGFFESP